MGCRSCGKKIVTCPHCSETFGTRIKRGDITCIHCNNVFVRTPEGEKSKEDYERWMQSMRTGN